MTKMEQNVLRCTQLSKEIVQDNEATFVLDLPKAHSLLRHGRVLLRGWAYRHGRPMAIQCRYQGEILAEVYCKLPRPGVPRAVKDSTATHCGFEVTVQLPRNDAGLLEVIALDKHHSRHAAYYLVLDTVPLPQRMFFIHIPKTAGTTINAFMEKSLARRECVFHVEGNSIWRRATHSLDGLQGKTYLSGHVRIHVALPKLDIHTTFITTVLREPITQIMSHIAWVRRLADPGEERRLYHHPQEIQELAKGLADVDMSSAIQIEHWLREMPEIAYTLFDNCQVRYLASRAPIDQVRPVDLQSARGNLQCFDLVGVTDKITFFLTQVAERMGVPPPDLGDMLHENVASTKYGLDPDDAEQRKILEPYYMYDLELYRDVQRMHQYPLAQN